MIRASPLARAVTALFLLPLLVSATPGPVLVPDVSQRDVEIRFSFTGAELLLFGAIVYPNGRLPSEPADIIVVLKGPSQAIVMREKQKLGGLIWVNADSIQFRSAPSFYAIASSRPLKQLVDERTAAIYELGLNNLQLSPSSVSDSAEIDRFSRGLNDLKVRTGLYVQSPGLVEITQGVLYRARLPLSARVVTGTYTAETFLIQKGRVVAAAVREIEVKKSGFERFFGLFARQHDIAYGLVAIAMALVMGLAAGYIARRV
ncbi:MAG TPA: TIGR02186 family protein [Sphingobium sp.]